MTIPYSMKTHYLNLPKYESLYYISKEGIEYERQDIIAVDKYTPGIEEWSPEIFDYIDGVDDIHRNIMKDIGYNSHFVIEYPKKFFNRIASKYNLNRQLMEQTMGEIRSLIKQNNLIRIDKNGNVLPMFYVMEDELA